ncbi:hypothetical protein HPP92_001110 [Vanilla planifolia]|uniref:noroxomaritidine synthase n=1 Tax=Vanilla planifolia TaxID=51239 RepID=A0A835VD92_VANPL|nr:hypothetical protein HPP92_001110 [Vanilla planifolia]
MEKQQEAAETIRRLVWGFFLSAAIFSVFLASVLALVRRRPWCTCAICRAYVTSSWSASFPNLADYYTHLLRNSPTRTIHVHVLNSTITANPSNVEHILRTRFDIYPKGPAFSAILGDLLGRGIFNADGDMWHFQRKLSLRVFSVSALRTFCSLEINSVLRQRLLPLLRLHRASPLSPFDLQSAFRRFTIDAVSAVALGLDPESHSTLLSAFSDAFEVAATLSAARAASPAPFIWRVKRLLCLGTERCLRKEILRVDAFAHRIIGCRRLLPKGQDLLSRFMASVDDDDYLRDIIVSFFLAGRDTVASALAGIFHLLLRYPAAVTAIRQEIVDRAVSADGDGGVVASWDQLREMSYVHAVVHEGMRLFPPIQFDSKFCAEDDVLPDGTFVRKGKRVTYHAYAMGRMEEEWGEDYGEFRPERWLRDGVFSPESPFKYPVFQGGQRQCVGKELAIMVMKAVVVAVIGEFDVELVDGKKTARFLPGLTATLQGGLPVTLCRRRLDGGVG